MTKKILSTRIKRLIELTKCPTYTTEELTTLGNILHNLFCSELAKGNTHGNNYQDLWLDTIDFIKNGYISDTLDEAHVQCEETQYGDTRYYEMNYLQYLLINHRKAFLFLALVPLDRVPLYINDPKLTPFVKWRLTIAK